MSARGFKGGGEEVHGKRLKIGGAGLDDAGPNGAGGDFDATFIHVLFFATEVSAVGTDVDLSTVVGDEEGEGVVPLAVFLEGGDDAPDAIVHVFDEGDEFGAFVRDAGFAVFHFGEPIGGRLNGSVWGVVGEVEEEGFRVFFGRVSGEVVGGPLGEEVGGVAFGGDRFSVEAHVVLVVAAVVVVVIHHVAEEAVEVFEAASVWVFGVVESEVPFADGGGGVSRFFKNLGEHDGGAGEEAPVVFRFGADDSGDADEIGVASGEERGTGGGADGAVGVEFGEAKAVGHEGIEVRALEVGGSVGGKVAVAEIVGDDEEDVGLAGCKA